MWVLCCFTCLPSWNSLHASRIECQTQTDNKVSTDDDKKEKKDKKNKKDKTDKKGGKAHLTTGQ